MGAAVRDERDRHTPTPMPLLSTHPAVISNGPPSCSLATLLPPSVFSRRCLRGGATLHATDMIDDYYRTIRTRSYGFLVAASTAFAPSSTTSQSYPKWPRTAFATLMFIGASSAHRMRSGKVCGGIAGSCG